MSKLWDKKVKILTFDFEFDPKETESGVYNIENYKP